MIHFEEIESLQSFLLQNPKLENCVVQGIDLTDSSINWKDIAISNTAFLGCTFPNNEVIQLLQTKGAALFPKFNNLPYQPYRPNLYTREELMEGWTPEEDNSVDYNIYRHFESNGRHQAGIMEMLSQRLHDHAIDDALTDLLSGKTENSAAKKVVGIMGGHGTSRTDPWFKSVVHTALGLTKAGYFVASGGGPGIMEATNLGAWLANEEDKAVEDALEIISKAPLYTDKDYVASAQEVLDKYPNGCASLAVPTWFYGHEPSNLFSSYIAKYFSNSLREDGLLAIATHGVVYAPGSAGTTQEIFMDATQNHYQTFEKISPMVFLSKDRYEKDTDLYKTLKSLAKGKKYDSLLHLTDSPDEVVQWIIDHPPIQ